MTRERSTTPTASTSGPSGPIFWTRAQLESANDRTNNEKRWEFLGELPRSYRLGPFLFVHGSPRNPLSEYIFPEDIYNHRKMERLFQLVEQYCFQGHTHVPGIFTESFQFYAPEEIDHEYTLGEGKVMVNVGSVGQPRDGDPRACYVILEDGQPEASSDIDLVGNGRDGPPRVLADDPADPDHLPPAALRLRIDHQEDLRHPRPRPLPRRPPPPGPLRPDDGCEVARKSRVAAIPPARFACLARPDATTRPPAVVEQK